MSVLKKTIVFLFLLCVCLAALITNILYTRLQKYKLAKRDMLLNRLEEQEIDHMEDDVMLHKFQKTSMKDRLIDMSKIMKHINEKQLIYNSRKFSQERFDNTVLVIKVHNNIRYLAVLIDSIRRMKLVTKSLLIFAHDFYDTEINSLIRRMPFARIMQIFYPYSAHLYPNLYPGDDERFCAEVHQCVSSSRKRNATLAQSKLFWWWVANHVFDQIDVLKNYDGYIYFLETELYLTSDFIHMSKMLEQLQPLFCPECRILSLGARPPRPELYDINNNKLILDVWGRSNYSNSIIGFNRKTWNEIKANKQEFCHFNDYSWESSLRHLASKTPEKLFLMLSTAGPRAFPTTGCGAFRNGTNCTLDTNFLDILEYIPKIEEGFYPRNFKLKVADVNETNPVEVLSEGGWEDARDKEFCMFFARRGSSAFY